MQDFVEDVYNLTHGAIVVRMPTKLTPEDVEDMVVLFELCLRSMRRRVAKFDPNGQEVRR